MMAFVANSVNGAFRYCGRLCATNSAPTVNTRMATRVNTSIATTSRNFQAGNGFSSGAATTGTDSRTGLSCSCGGVLSKGSGDGFGGSDMDIGSIVEALDVRLAEFHRD